MSKNVDSSLLPLACICFLCSHISSSQHMLLQLLALQEVTQSGEKQGARSSVHV